MIRESYYDSPGQRSQGYHSVVGNAEDEGTKVLLPESFAAPASRPFAPSVSPTKLESSPFRPSTSSLGVGRRGESLCQEKIRRSRTASDRFSGTGESGSRFSGKIAACGRGTIRSLDHLFSGRGRGSSIVCASAGYRVKRSRGSALVCGGQPAMVACENAYLCRLAKGRRAEAFKRVGVELSYMCSAYRAEWYAELRSVIRCECTSWIPLCHCATA